MAPAALPRVGGPLHLPLRERSTWSSESGPTAAAPRKGAANGRQERAGRERGACAGSEVSPGWWPARPEPAPRTVRSLAAGPLRSARPGSRDRRGREEEERGRCGLGGGRAARCQPPRPPAPRSAEPGLAAAGAAGAGRRPGVGSAPLPPPKRFSVSRACAVSAAMAAAALTLCVA